MVRVVGCSPLTRGVRRRVQLSPDSSGGPGGYTHALHRRHHRQRLGSTLLGPVALPDVSALPDVLARQAARGRPGGIATTAEALRAGTPQLVVPLASSAVHAQCVPLRRVFPMMRAWIACATPLRYCIRIDDVGVAAHCALGAPAL
jgi:hypothetical protein